MIEEPQIDITYIRFPYTYDPLYSNLDAFMPVTFDNFKEMRVEENEKSVYLYCA